MYSSCVQLKSRRDCNAHAHLQSRSQTSARIAEVGAVMTMAVSDVRIWTWFLRKYVYFRVINADVNPYCKLANA